MPDIHLTAWSLVLRITIKRHEVNETERYAQLVWYICMTDILVALCGCGSGGFVKAMLQYGLFPIDTRLVVSAASGMVRNEESEYMSLVMNFDGEIAVMAARLGLMARQLRRDAEQQTHVDETSFVSMQMGPGHRQQQISVIQQDLRWKWHQKPPELMLGIRHNTLPAKVQGYYDHVSRPIFYCFAAYYIRASFRQLAWVEGLCNLYHSSSRPDYVMLQRRALGHMGS